MHSFQGERVSLVFLLHRIHLLIILLFALRTTKTGELPNISYVKRKPEPLGTEVKNIVDGISGSMLWIEIQEGKERMKNKEFQNLGSTAACTLRGVMATKDFDSYPVPAPIPVPNLNVEEEDENNSPPHSNPQDPKRVWRQLVR